MRINLRSITVIELIIEGEIEKKSVSKLEEYGENSKIIKEIAPVIAKAVSGEGLTSQERSILQKSEVASRVINELSADRSNTVWKDKIKNKEVTPNERKY